MRIVHMLVRFVKHPNLFVKFRDFIANESKKTWNECAAHFEHIMFRHLCFYTRFGQRSASKWRHLFVVHKTSE